VTPSRHALRIVLLTAAAAALLGRLASTTQVMYADGLRFVASARAVDRGDWSASVVRAVDHPAYPVAVAAARRAFGIADTPEGWQTAAQVVSVLAGAALVAPLYLVALELFGATAAWLACLLTFLVPTTGHVLGDVLSEGVFLLAWTWGVWCALRFFRAGAARWLVPTIACAGLAYLTRPEGLLLPVALATALMLAPLSASWRLPRAAWLKAAALVVVGPMLVVGPYIALKGGIGTKPAVARLLGTAPKSAAMAVERERPLDPDQSAWKAFATAWRGMFRAVQGAVTTPLLILAAVGLARRAPATDPGQARGRLFVAIYGSMWMLALVRLYATGGYCTPRHALILALPLIALAAHGLSRIGERVAARRPEGSARPIRGLTQGLGDVLRRPPRLLLRRLPRRGRRRGPALRRGPRRLPDRRMAVLPGGPRPRRRPAAGRLVPRAPAQGDLARPRLRPGPRHGPRRRRRGPLTHQPDEGAST
jgi:4-amino-4-deoxy-L-arabinose transferase-like glycosyltransferase